MSVRMLAVLLLAAFGLTLTGCETEDPNSCDYWTKRLSNPGTAREALLKVSEMKCDGIAPTVQQMFSDSQYQDDVLMVLNRLGDRKLAGELIGRALRIKKLGSRAASIAEEMRLTEARNALEEIMTTSRNPSAREPALKARVNIVEPKELEDLLIQVLNSDPAIHGIKVNALAAQELGKLRSEKAIPALIKGLFIQDAHKREAYQAARQALLQIGASAVDPLIQTVRGTYEPFKTFVKTKNIPTWKWQRSPKLPQVLGDLRSPEGAVAVAEAMTRDFQLYDGLSDEQRDPARTEFDALRQEWTNTLTNGLTVGMIALGQIGSDSAMEILVKTIPNQNKRDASQRLNAATALAMIGSEKTVEALIGAYKSESDYRFRAAMLLPLSMAMSFDKMKIWDEIEAYTKPKRKGKPLYREQQWLKDQMEDPHMGPRLKSYINVVRSCKDNATCYVTKLKSEDLSTRMKSALMLARGIAPGKETYLALLTAYGASTPAETDYRRFLLMAMGRIGTAAQSGETTQAADAMQAKGKGERYWAEELRLLASYLSTKKG